MITVRVCEGLGNQMFQYAYARSLKLRGFDVQLDSSAFVRNKPHIGYGLNKYNIQLSDLYQRDCYVDNQENVAYVEALYSSLSPCCVIREGSLEFDPSLFIPRVETDAYIQGFFQNEHYFSYIRDTLLQELQLKEPISNYAKNLERQILNTPNSVAIHFRLGDYLSEENSVIHGFCGIDYYQRAIQYLSESLKDTVYFVFSNDIAWCKSNLTSEQNNLVFIEQRNRIPHEDIHLMSLCQHHIIANSSFSWWGAWLCRNPTQIVIAPKQWFADPALQAQSGEIACKHWIKL